MDDTGTYKRDAAGLLRKMIRIKSFSGGEKERSDFLFDYLRSKGASPARYGLNIVCRTRQSGNAKPYLLLDAHIDTVLPSPEYTFDPFNPPYDSGTIFGLGSNDDGGSVASMIHTFLYFNDNREELERLGFDVMLSLTVEEERVGENGIRILRDHLEGVEFAIVGEPTGMKAAIGERGLLVVDAVAEGISGHAARDEGVNALYIALDDIEKVRSFKFGKVSPKMGEVRMTVTQIQAGTQHNVIPDRCDWVIDIRPTDMYSPEEIMEILGKELKSKLKARNLEHNSSSLPEGHPVFKALESTGMDTYISPTTSDWTRMPVPAVKIGPGESSRSHRADEFILVSEINEAIDTYIELIKKITL